MSESERVAATCPACSPDLETVHEVLKPGGEATVRCTECGHVHKTRIETETTEEIKVVVSQEGESFTATADVPPDETLAVGEEFLLDSEELLGTVRITSLEMPSDQRVDEAEADDVATIWGRVVDNVAVNVTIHPKEGSHDDSRSVTVRVPGDYEFTVGRSESHGDEEFTVEQIHVTDDAAGYDREQFDQRGDDVQAKDVKRIFARDETSEAWSAW